jgi:Mg2+ and Co2+ transporter CorA
MKLFASVRLTRVRLSYRRQIFNIHPLTTEDIQTDTTREKFEAVRFVLL